MSHSVRTRVPLVLLAAVACAAPALATCGSANCFLVTGTREGINDQGAFTFDLSYRYVDQSRGLDGSRETGDVLTPAIDFSNGTIVPDHHREIRTLNTLMQLDLDYGLTGRLTLFGAIPFLNERRHEHVNDVGTATEAFTNGDGTSGFGDVRIGARYAAVVRPKQILVAGAAVKLPTGPYRLLDSEGEINEPTIQPGTGAYALNASIYYAYHPAPRSGEWFVSGSYQGNRANALEYRLGAEAIVNVGFDRRAGKRATWVLQLDSRWTRRDEFLGSNVASTGAAIVNFTPGLRFVASPGTVFYIFGQAPVVERVNESQLAPRGGVIFGISKTFD
ncbi:MAG: hypothetical protein HY049_15765 [Acidobacteria bacterium]|nr:hypothetical protein [Acidobacteriota bacterium]